MKKYILAVIILAAAMPSLAAPSVSADSVRKYTDWLYATMNIADIHNFPRSFWERNVASALQTRQEMPWGKTVPMREWLHFVLPVRVNNERPDSSRMVFYREIAPRVRDMSMEQAALEVNHWAHEKATYRPSDARTSSPLATVRTTFGRCGEESTLAVAAMRAVGIPARQIYTPRWAHTDDNHAWVEVWIDGVWRFLGACEPEPVLDLGWFNAPASQGMLMATNVIGDYRGPEQRLYRDSCYTRINITSNYAPVRTASVRVTDAHGHPVAGAPVDFRLYNYAELYPLFSTKTDADGTASLICGHGDLVAWATAPDGGSYGFAELDGKSDDTVTVVLADNPLATPVEFMLTPPAASPRMPRVTAEQTAANDARKAREDSMRNATMSRFFTADAAARVLTGWDSDDAAYVSKVLAGSYGNRDNMERFVNSVSPGRRGQARRWLASLSEKDWRDVSWPVIEAFFINRDVPVNPRISNEELTTWISDFDAVVPAALRDSLAVAPHAVEQWVNANIAVDNEHNPNQFCMAPLAVWKARRADSHSRDIFFVALCRWLGFDAIIDPVTSSVQVRGGAEKDTYTPFVSETVPSSLIRVRIAGGDDAKLHNPRYYSHFTISRIDNGRPELLNYPEEATWRDTFADGVSLMPGRYLLTTGRRLADGSVKARLAAFDVNAGDTVVRVPLTIPDDTTKISVIGSFNADPLLPLTGRGFFVAAFVRANHEPSAHFINELIGAAGRIEAWPRPVVLIAPDDGSAAIIRSMAGLPANVTVASAAGLDPTGAWLPALAAEFGLPADTDNRPVVMIADTFNRVLHLASGYRPGSVDTLLLLLPRLQ